MTRALMEGVLYGLRDGLEIMRGLDVDPKRIRAIGGGSTSELWLQLQADVLGAPVQQLAIPEGAAYGAALLGHVAAGTFADVNEAVKVVRTRERVTEPAPDSRRALRSGVRGLSVAVRSLARADASTRRPAGND